MSQERRHGGGKEGPVIFTKAKLGQDGEEVMGELNRRKSPPQKLRAPANL